MPVIEAQCASILVPHDHRHINHDSALPAVPTLTTRLDHSRSLGFALLIYRHVELTPPCRSLVPEQRHPGMRVLPLASMQIRGPLVFHPIHSYVVAVNSSGPIDP